MTHDYHHDHDRLLTVGEAANFLRVSKNSLNWMRSHGGGPASVRVGRQVRYRVSDLKAYIVEVPPKNARAS